MSLAREVRGVGEHRRVPMTALRLDSYNPRLPSDMHGEGQEELAVHLELGFDALTVAESIASHGYFGSEPLIVIADQEIESRPRRAERDHFNIHATLRHCCKALRCNPFVLQKPFADDPYHGNMLKFLKTLIGFWPH